MCVKLKSVALTILKLLAFNPQNLGVIVTLIPSGLTKRILTYTELKGHCFVLISGYVY